MKIFDIIGWMILIEVISAFLIVFSLVNANFLSALGWFITLILSIYILEQHQS